MIVRIIRTEEPKQDLQARLSEAMLFLGRDVLLDEALLCFGRPKSAETLSSGSPRRRGVEQNAEMARFGPFHLKFPTQLRQRGISIQKEIFQT